MSGLFGGSSSTVTQQPLLTPEQQQAMDSLLKLGTTGSNGNITLGTPYTGSLGDFSPTATQGTAGNQLQSLLNSATPAGYTTAENTLSGLANNKFDPNDPSNGYGAFKNQAAMDFNNANNVLNREASITGDRFSTAIGQNKANLAAQNNNTISSQLASLYNTAQDRSLNAATALGSLTSADQGNQRANIAAGLDPLQGGLQNTLNNAAAQASYQEFQRQRNEQLKSIDVLNTVYNKNVPYGVLSSTATTPSPFSGLLNAALGAAGTAIGGPVGGAIAGGLSSLFTSATKGL